MTPVKRIYMTIYRGLSSSHLQLGFWAHLADTGLCNS